MTNLERLVVLARRARVVFERIAVRRNWHSDLCGWCKDATVFIFDRAREMGINADMGHIPGHWFVLLDNMVVDITATQFGRKEPVTVMPLEEARKAGWWWHLEPHDRISTAQEPWDVSLIEEATKEMGQEDFKQLLRLARIARSAYEVVARECGYKPDLGGLCYDASQFLRRMAFEHGIITDLGAGRAHWFVLFGDTVVDITATQFGVQENIAVLPLVEARERGDWWKLEHRSPDFPTKSWSIHQDTIAENAVKVMEEKP